MNDATTPRPASWAAALAAVAVAGVITGCSATPSQPAASGPASTAPARTAPASTAAAPSSTAPSSTAASTPTAPAAATPVSTVSAVPSATPAGPVPVLGQLTGVFAQGQGFGQAEPAKIFNGGDPTGLVRHIQWQSWGGSRAVGYGRAEYVGPNQTVATGTQKRATVVAFHLGRCGGKLMYQAVEWYFPGEHQSFSTSHYENVCTGSYVPNP
ncbi:MAG TPA: hypothetical protein VMH35_18555 [Streptosporangiaceae bacterium]|nr:hypothetical protein [Streptosporangiaceae bacterium]